MDKENIIPLRNDYAVCRCLADRISGMYKCNERKYTRDLFAFYFAALSPSFSLSWKTLRIVRSIFECGQINCFPRFQVLITPTNKVQFELATIHYPSLLCCKCLSRYRPISIGLSSLIQNMHSTDSRATHVSQLILSCINISLVILKEIGRSRNGRVAFDFVLKSVNL